MCGIAGALYRNWQTPVNPVLLPAMTDLVRHRGPDGEGLHIVAGLGVGHRCLAIIDPAAGHQPMMDAESQNIIVYNAFSQVMATTRCGSVR